MATGRARTGAEQAADRRQKRVRGDDLIVLGGLELHPRTQMSLLGVQHVEHRALTDVLFLAHAFKRNLVASTCDR